MTKLLRFLRPYWKSSVAALVLLTVVLVIDLAIPRLIQRIIDEGMRQGNMDIVLQTAAIMLGSLAQIADRARQQHFSIRVGEAVARDLREALFLKIQSFSHGNIDRFTTGKLMVRLSSPTRPPCSAWCRSRCASARAPRC
jgi:ATP-binding cassette, subfamily B, multidrug efflux pump